MQRRSIDFLVVLWVFFARFSGFNKVHFNKCKREGRGDEISRKFMVNLPN